MKEFVLSSVVHVFLSSITRQFKYFNCFFYSKQITLECQLQSFRDCKIGSLDETVTPESTISDATLL